MATPGADRADTGGLVGYCGSSGAGGGSVSFWLVEMILIPGLWLDASSWEAVVPVLEQAGHQARPLTLPGMESRNADRSGITLRDHVDAVVAAIDAADG